MKNSKSGVRATSPRGAGDSQVAKRTSRTTLSLTPEAVATLRLLADRLGFGGNVSEFLRWLAYTADGSFDETVTLLKTAGAIAAGGDDWTVLAVVERLLPALRLTVDWQRVDNPPRFRVRRGGWGRRRGGSGGGLRHCCIERVY